jgi:hypothetical protein
LFHRTETSLIKILEHYFGIDDVITSYRPLWAVSSKGALYEFDAYIISLYTLIEYDGVEHYKFVKMFHKNRKGFSEQIERDLAKAKLAKERGLKLIVFNYTEPIVNDYVINKIVHQQHQS